MKTISAHGAEIPALGFGTFQMEEDEAEESVREALDIGYRHIDTAQIYGNEAGVGRAIAASSVDRDDIFLTTKVWPDYFAPKDFRDSVDESLRKLQTDRVDLLLLHWPKFDGPMAPTVNALNQVHDDGKALHIGVSNFTVDLLTRARNQSAAPLVTNQVEYHPFLRQTPVLDAVREAGMMLTAYSPLARGKVLDSEVLQDIGARHGKSPVQVSLRWLLQQDAVSAIPKASSSSHRRANFEVFDFELSDDEMTRIHDLARPDGRLISPSTLAPNWDDAWAEQA